VRSDQERLGRLLGYAVLASSGLVFGSWLLIAVAHVRDRFNVGHVTGTWFALARYTNEGTLYPPLFDGHAFGGTRYMPLQFVTHAGLARVTGDYLVSGKLLAYASAAALFALMFVVCRRVGGSSVLAAGLVAAVLSTGAGMLDSTTIRGDTLPVALQLGALYVVTRRTEAGTYRSIVGAASCARLHSSASRRRCGDRSRSSRGSPSATGGDSASFSPRSPCVEGRSSPPSRSPRTEG
jgi:hypothetical protein